MSWLRIDDKFGHHPKVLALTDREFRAHVLTLCYCALHRTHGSVPRSAWKTLGITPKMSQRFIDLGLWDDDGGEYAIHDWGDYNPRDPTAAERMQRHRDRNADRNGSVTEPVTPTVTDTVTKSSRYGPSRVGARARPVPSPTPTPEEHALQGFSSTSPEGLSVASYATEQASGIESVKDIIDQAFAEGGAR